MATLNAQTDIVVGNKASAPFLRFLQALQNTAEGKASPADIAALSAQVAQIQSQVGSIAYPKLQVAPPLISNGLLQNGLAQLGVMIANSIIVNDEALQLDGDTAAPGNTYLYSTGTTGIKGWNPLGGMVAGTAGNITATVNADGTVTFNLATVTDAGGGTLQKTAFDAYGRKTGTSAATTTDLTEGTNLYYTDARADARISLQKAQPSGLATLDSGGKLDAGQLPALAIPKGYIDGLQVQWVSATALTISSGAAYVESTGTILQSDSAIALTGLVLAANTWYHLYLYDNAGTPAVECVTTAPATPYSGTARSKTGDTTRRYVGSVLTDTSGNIYQFSTAGNRFNFLTPPNTSTFRVVDNGAATASTNIDCSGAIPATATHFWGRLLSAAAGGITTFMANPDIGAASTTNFIVAIGPGNIAWIDYPVSTTQQINYMSSPAAGSLKLDIGGFLFTR